MHGCDLGNAQKSRGTKLVFEQHVLTSMHELMQGSGCAIGQCNAKTMMVCFNLMLSVCVATSSHDIVYSNLLLAQKKVCCV